MDDLDQRMSTHLSAVDPRVGPAPVFSASATPPSAPASAHCLSELLDAEEGHIHPKHQGHTHIDLLHEQFLFSAAGIPTPSSLPYANASPATTATTVTCATSSPSSASAQAVRTSLATAPASLLNATWSDPQAVLRVGILTVSDRVSAGQMQDEGGPALSAFVRERFSASFGSVALSCAVVPDEETDIRRELLRWTDGHPAAHLVLTTGGTGFAPRDRTPEAVGPLLHRQAPGLVIRMITESLRITPHGMLSRGLAGTRHSTLIVCLPGRPKAALENLDALVSALPHALRLLSPNQLPRRSPVGSSSSLSLSSSSASASTSSSPSSASVSSSPSSSPSPSSSSSSSSSTASSTTPTTPTLSLFNAPKIASSPSTVHECNCFAEEDAPEGRKSSYPLQSAEQALRLVCESARSLSAQPAWQTGLVETVLLREALGRVLATSVRSSEDLPALPTSMKDGYAVHTDSLLRRAAANALPSGDQQTAGSENSSATNTASPTPTSTDDTAVILRVDGHEQSAGATGHAPPLAAGCARRIATGAPLPPGSNAVLMVEFSEVVEQEQDRELAIRVLCPLSAGQDVRPVGCDVRAGEEVLPAGCLLGAAEIGLLASLGLRRVSVRRQLRVGVLSTGDELEPEPELDGTSRAADPTSESTTSESATGESDTAASTLPPGLVRDSNRPSLMAAVREVSGGAWIPVDLGCAADTDESVVAALQRAVKARVDLLVSSGGASMGHRDLLKELCSRFGELRFGRVRLKPGKPLGFAELSRERILAASPSMPPGGDREHDPDSSCSDSQEAAASSALSASSPLLLLCTPGNPVSCLVTFYLFGVPLLRTLNGCAQVNLPRVRVRLADAVALDRHRPEYKRAVVSWDDAQNGYVASTTGVQRSSRLLSMRGANALLELPASDGRLEVGAHINALLIPPVRLFRD